MQQDHKHGYFQKLYASLNDEQKQVVSDDRSALITVTNNQNSSDILAAKIAYAIVYKDCSPGEFLCLCHSNEAAVAIQKKLTKILDFDAYIFKVYAVEEYCKLFIKDHLFQLHADDLIPASELEKVSTYKKLFEALSVEKAKNTSKDYYNGWKQLQKMHVVLRQQGWTSSFILSTLENYEQSFDPQAEDEISRIAFKRKFFQLKSAVQILQQYNALLQTINRYDENSVVELLLAMLQSGITVNKDIEPPKYLLIEGVDLLSQQENEFINFLFGDVETHWLFTNKSLTEEDLPIDDPVIGKTINLLKQQPIIHHYTQSNIACVIHQYETLQDEAKCLVEQLKCLLNNNKTTEQIGICHGDDFPKDYLLAELTKSAIPYQSIENKNCLETTVVQQIILLLRYISAEHEIPFSGDELLFTILHFSIFGIPTVEIAKLSIAVADKRYTATPTSIRSLLFEKATYEKQDLFVSESTNKLVVASKVIEDLISSLANHTLQEVVTKVVSETGLLGKVMLKESSNEILAVNAFYAFVRQENNRNPWLTIQKLLSIVDAYKDQRISITYKEVIGNFAGIKILPAGIASSHQFDQVFIVGFTSAFSKNQQVDPFSLIEVMKTIRGEACINNYLYQQLQQLLFTANKKVTISYSRYNHHGQLNKIGSLLQTINAEVISHPKTISSEDHFTTVDFIPTIFQPTIQPSIKEMVQPVIDKFVMNVSALNTYLQCPLQFYFNYILRVPSSKSDAAEFGCAVHYALQLLFEKMQNSKNIFPAIDGFISDFKWYMYQHREAFTTAQFNKRLQHGSDMLADYYTHNISRFNKIVVVERSIRNLVVKGIPMKGKIDKLEFVGNLVNIVDYKTGNIDYAIKSLEPPNEQQPNGGNYWRQAVFYNILVNNLNNNWKAASTSFDFIERDHNNDFRTEKVIVGDNDITTVINQASTVWNKIQQHDFYTGCGHEHCYWCNFAAKYGLTVPTQLLNS